jgi:hypothetical protein
MGVREDNLRARIKRVLCTDACSRIRFSAGNIFIGRFMYNWIADAIAGEQVYLTISHGGGYTPKTNTLDLEEGCDDATIVHESTHVLINTHHKGESIVKLLNEGAAYLAEALWALNAGRDVGIYDVSVRIQCLRVAHRIKAFNDATPSSVYVCDPVEPGAVQGPGTARPFGRT